MTNSPEQGCIFCKIIAGELPAGIVYEDEHTVGILDIMPRWAKGQCLVFPKKHVDRFYDMDNDKDLAGLFQGVAEVARKIKKALKPDVIATLTQRQQVKHAHVIVFPSAITEPRRFDESFAPLPRSELDEIADQIRRA